MTPLVDNPGFERALQVYVDSTQFGPPDEINLDVGDTRSLFTTGRCALSIDWGDIGPLAVDPDESRVIDKVGAVILPGSREVLDRETMTMVACDDATCPHAIDGVNRAPFAAFGGWSGGINAAADERVKEAAYPKSTTKYWQEG
jgi:multiple sugar transport system substrate-binding protein